MLARSVEERTIRRLSRTIVPFLFVLLIVNYLDRVNVGFAAIHMNAQLGLTASAFGLGAGIFFVGYALFEVPSNLVLHRVGARMWIGRIMITWGLVSAAMAFVRGEWSFLAVRFLLGVAEAGFLPGVVFYLTLWFPAAHRAQANSGVVVATALASVVGAPLSGLVMSGLDGAEGFAGWQWMFFLEALPALLLGIVVLAKLPDTPDSAAWLPADEKAWLVARLAEERDVALADGARHRPLDCFRVGRVWALGATFACYLTGFYGVLLWTPQIVKALVPPSSDIAIGALSAVPFACAAGSMILVGRRSDRVGERSRHFAVPVAIGGLALLAGSLVPSPTVAFILLCVAAAGVWGGLGVFWAMTSSGFLTGAASASGIALINTIAQSGGLVGPWVVGILRDATHAFGPGLAALGAFALAAAAIAIAMVVGEGSGRPANAMPSCTSPAAKRKAV